MAPFAFMIWAARRNKHGQNSPAGSRCAAKGRTESTGRAITDILGNAVKRLAARTSASRATAMRQSIRYSIGAQPTTEPNFAEKAERDMPAIPARRATVQSARISACMAVSARASEGSRKPASSPAGSVE
jgi:hypothetical protein